MKTLLHALLITLTSTAFAGERPVEVPSASAALTHAKGATVTLLNVWATWCVPCVAEMKDLEELHQTYRDQGLEVVGISMDDMISDDREGTKKKVVRFLDAKSITFTNVYYTGKPDELMNELDFEGEIPITILYDRKGNELLRVQGIIVRKEFEKQLRAILTAQK